MSLKYNRVLIKLSGEALAGDKGFGLDYPTVVEICENIKRAYELGAEIAIVVGGGNFWRGRSSGDMERTRADQIGMLATVMNALSMADALEKLGLEDDLVQKALNPLENVKMRTVPGGPSPAMVEIARDNIKEFLNEEFEKKGI